MSHEMTAQLARALLVFEPLPTAQRLRRSDRQAGIDTEGIEQTVGGETSHVSTIPFVRFVVNAVGQ
jgi:hypothetical protein